MSDLVDDSSESRHGLRVKDVSLRVVDWHANLAGLGMDAPWRLEQVIYASGDVRVQTRVQVREDQRLDRQVFLSIKLGLSPCLFVLFSPLLVLLLVDLPHLHAETGPLCRWVQLIPSELDLVADVVVCEETKELVSMDWDGQ